jgi:hypothetical protein
VTAAAKIKIAEFKRVKSEFRKVVREKIKKSSPEQRFAAMVQAGIVTKAGKLTAAYRD